ncbi:MAG TPA: ABC transporter ATP-binding protein [Mycobacteriales bacterium]|jgi:ABC-2 type transport system ATP-binding protein|nr:ABC transporter ATP-binding protein [Mycobacteriales bacterium]
MAAIVVDDLRKSYGATRAVQGVSFTVDEGECVALLGPNGAGKTTTLEVLEGYLQRDAGRVEVLGADPQHATREWREQIGIVLQGTAVDPYLTVRETLTRTANFYAKPRDVEEVIAVVGLEEKADSRINKLSGGQQRRLDVAYGIVGNPKLLFLDEPTTGFDPSARRGAWDMVNDLRGLGTTIMLTTHYMDEAQALADNIVVIGAGQVVAEGTPDSLGGRDTAALHVRFRLPDGVDPAALPVEVTVDHHGFCELTTSEDIKVLNTLTSWSLKQNVALEGLVATRPSLEDIYLSLVSRDLLDGEATTGAHP